jgi:DNA-binding CsgD family transcriptional regulator/tetratricopeptide (TPR) repeat protein
VFPGPFTLEGAEAVAGGGAAAVVVRLVDCSLLNPPQAGPDGRARYLMLESLRAYGAALLAEAGEQDAVALALAEYALRVAKDASPGLETSAGELAAARWLDAEDVTTRQALAWAREHDADIALRLAVTLGWWWFLRGRLAEGYQQLREAAGHAEVGSEDWCDAQFWLGFTALFSADLAGSLDHFTALREAVTDRPPSPALADALVGRSVALQYLGQIPEASQDGRQALAVAREVGYPAGEVLALGSLSLAAEVAGDLDGAVQLARHAAQITKGTPGSLARMCSYILTEALTLAGDLAEAGRLCAAALAQSRAMGDVWNLTILLLHKAVLDLRANNTDDAAAHLNETIQIGLRGDTRMDLLSAVDCCGHLCAQTGRAAEALTVWAATDALMPREVTTDWLELQLDPPRQVWVSQAEHALGPARARAAEERGAAMSLATAAEFALMLTAPGPRQPAAQGLGTLSARERELVTLVARGRTDAQIAEQLHISIRTVRSHLDRIRDKTGCRRRADLTRLALTAGLI